MKSQNEGSRGVYLQSRLRTVEEARACVSNRHVNTIAGKKRDPKPDYNLHKNTSEILYLGYCLTLFRKMSCSWKIVVTCVYRE